MINIFEQTSVIKKEGYSELNAQAKLCQDIVLEALARSDLSRNVTIKGGVVMRSISGNVRRATQDMDIDFIRYSLEENAIYSFISKLNVIDGISISVNGKIEELRQQDYHGKRVNIQIADTFGNVIYSKIDLGVHNKFEIEQEEYCFDIAFDNEGASLLINSKEQILTEKLRSVLKFGGFSTRYKDIFDICYLIKFVDKNKLSECLEVYIYEDKGMKENTIEDVIARVQKTFSNKQYIRNLETSKKNWLDISKEEVLNEILAFLKSLSK